MIVESADRLPFLPMLILDVSNEHSHRRTAVVADDDESAIPDRASPAPRRRRLIGFLAATALAVGILAVTVGVAPAAPARPAAEIDPGFRLGPGLAQPPGYAPTIPSAPARDFRLGPGLAQPPGYVR
jgi:hypothetical protein